MDVSGYSGIEMSFSRGKEQSEDEINLVHFAHKASTSLHQATLILQHSPTNTGTLHCCHIILLKLFIVPFSYIPLKSRSELFLTIPLRSLNSKPCPSHFHHLNQRMMSIVSCPVVFRSVASEIPLRQSLILFHGCLRQKVWKAASL